MTDEQIQAVTIGELQPLSAPIRLVEYDPAWPDRFGREAERIRAVLGDKVLQLEHVGSTAVPGLPAKPIIDLLLVLENCPQYGCWVPGRRPRSDDGGPAAPRRQVRELRLSRSADQRWRSGVGPESGPGLLVQGSGWKYPLGRGTNPGFLGLGYVGTIRGLDPRAGITDSGSTVRALIPQPR